MVGEAAEGLRGPIRVESGGLPQRARQWESLAGAEIGRKAGEPAGRRRAGHPTDGGWPTDPAGWPQRRRVLLAGTLPALLRAGRPRTRRPDHESMAERRAPGITWRGRRSAAGGQAGRVDRP